MPARQPEWLRPWVDDPEEPARQAAAVALASWAVSAPELLDRHRRFLLNEACWWMTGHNGKWQLRYRTAGALATPAGGPSTLRHEHVVTRRSLVARMLAEPQRVAEVLSEAVGCVVTKPEHDLLTAYDRTHAGWDRYLAAGLTVQDMKREVSVIEAGALVNGGPLIE